MQHHIKDKTQKIVAYLNAHKGQVAHVDAIMAETGFDKGQVQRTINSLINGSKLDIEVVVRSNAWIYRGISAEKANGGISIRSSAPSATPQYFEYLATTKSNELLIQDEDGRVYLATPFRGQA